MAMGAQHCEIQSDERPVKLMERHVIPGLEYGGGGNVPLSDGFFLIS